MEMTMMITMRMVNIQRMTYWIVLQVYIIIGLFEEQIEPTPTMVPTAVRSKEPIPQSQQLPLPVPSFSDVVATSTTTEGQPWMIEQSAELSKCREFVMNTCGCTRSSGKPCSTLFTEEHYVDLRAQASFLTHEQLDLVILGSIMATVNKDELRPTYTRHIPAKRQRMVTTYMHHGHHLCKNTYNFLHGIGNHRVKAVKQSYLQNGLTVRIHGNTGRTPHNALSFQQISNIVKFIQNYAEQHAILLPGRIPAYKRDDLKLLPSSDSKKVHSIHVNKWYLI